ncbi:unnamed protein product [Onchocerca ochengi]|uniref:LisH domain-containing protein n=1 Tax=Onchocerca ochengi TaxID=42157 RepID=A0A182ELD6_ONCOC|nr:unnamed protein product [Onchocerca ochengi]
MIPLFIQQCRNLRRSICSNLRKLSGGLAVGGLIGFIILEFGFEDLEFCIVAIVMALGNKNKKKKGLVAALSHKTLKKVQSSFWQAVEPKVKEISSSKPLKNTKEYHSAQISSEHEADSFVTSLSNLSVSLPSNSSGSYMTALCENGGASDEMFKIKSPTPFVPEGADREELLPSRRQGSFDSGKGGSPPPPHIDVLDLEVNDGKYEALEKVPSTSLSEISRKSSLELLNKETRSLQIILDELQSKTVSDDVKAKNLASLNRAILQYKDYTQRFLLRHDLMSLGLFNALPSLIESRSREVESELEIFFASESNDNLVGSGTRHPIDIFQALDILELIARIQPSDKRLHGVLDYLQRGHLQNKEVQTETSNLAIFLQGKCNCPENQIKKFQ